MAGRKPNACAPNGASHHRNKAWLRRGSAFATIQKKRLYKTEFPNFEAYCRAKWEYDKRYVYRLISEAQLATYLGTNCPPRKPDHESQLRPLVGLTLEQAKSAWERVVQKAGDRRITARMVKSAVHELKFGVQAATAPQKQGLTKAERRKLVDDTIGQILALLSQKVAHAVLTEKVEALHGHIQALFASSVRKK